MNLYNNSKRVQVLDALYGPISFSEELSALMRAPVVQRMRHIRLSNIDSLALPGIAGLSRFEHVLGTAHLSSIVGCAGALSSNERIALQAAALMHDWAITAFGHLVEEAFAYAGSGFNHEGKLHDLVASSTLSDIGGANKQVLRGRETGILDWCSQVFGNETDKYLKLITETISGRGVIGPVIAGAIDLDNIDNLHRIAFHMGLEIDKEAPIRLSRSLLGASATGNPIFASEAREDLLHWVKLRRDVYAHLMLAQPDFTTKLMLLYATVQAMRANEFTDQDWSMTDLDFVSRLLQSNVKETRETAERWMAGEFWEMAPLIWLSGTAPEYSQIAAFSDVLAKEIKRPVFAYRIKDKRERLLTIEFAEGDSEVFGHSSKRWLLGIGSPAKRTFTKVQISGIQKLASTYFKAQILLEPAAVEAQTVSQGSLL
jgi:HD superfamily phosphohydrolase